MKYKLLSLLVFTMLLSCKKDLNRKDLKSLAEYGQYYIEGNLFSDFLELTNHYHTRTRLENFMKANYWPRFDDTIFSSTKIEVLDFVIRGSHQVVYYLFSDDEVKEVVFDIGENENGYFFTEYLVNNLTWECKAFNNLHLDKYANPIVLKGVNFLPSDNRKVTYFEFKNQGDVVVKDFEGFVKISDNRNGKLLLDKFLTFRTSISPMEISTYPSYELDNHFYEIVDFDDSYLNVSFVVTKYSPSPKKLSCDKIKSLEE